MSSFFRPFLYALVSAFIFISSASFADTSCSFGAVSAVSFGAYDVFSSMPNNNGVGSMSIDCKGAGNDTFEVTLSAGQSQNYAARLMKSGSNKLNYNLYTGADRSVVWGDGSGGSQVMRMVKNKPVTLTVFGQIPAGQDAAVGMYTDTIVVMVNF